MAAGYTDTVCLGNTVLAIPPIFPGAHNMPMGYLDQLAELRKRKGFTQQSLADEMGVEQPTVQRWEKGKREPSIGQLLELAKVLDVEPGSLIDPSIAASI